MQNTKNKKNIIVKDVPALAKMFGVNFTEKDT